MKFVRVLSMMVTVSALLACSDSFTDIRDGQSYNIVQIGDLLWMAENLNFAGVDAAGSTSGSCPDGEDKNCKKMGRLYAWADAQNICPEGWRLPSKADFDALVVQAGGASAAGKSLKSTRGWFKKGNGSDDYGFAGLPAGYRRLDGRFDGIGGNVSFWSASENSDGAAFYLELDFSSPAAKLEAFGKGEGRSVRCMKKVP